MLPPERRALVTLSAAVATRDASVLRRAMEQAAEAADAAAVDEVLLQAHLFVGFPDALNALTLWREVSGTRAPGGAGEDPAGWPERGARVCAAVYGRNYPRLREHVRTLHPDLDDWMVSGGYGRVLGRSGLDLRTRELCIVALLVVWDVPRQLHSHLRGALNAGAAAHEVDEAVECAAAHCPPATGESARALWRRVRDAAAACS